MILTKHFEMCTLSIISKQIKGSLFKKTRISTLQRCITGVSEESKRQNDLFVAEQKRQKELIGRIEKIDVSYDGPPENAKLVMNKNLSTPYDCAKHLGSTVLNKAVVALLNRETLWHMHRPLPDSCTLELLHYHLPNPASVNKTFWRSCGFILGAVISDAFKDTVRLNLHSFPSPNVKTGSFVYDVQLSLDDWRPTKQELKVLSIEMIKFCQQNHPIECLNVEKDIALDIFKSNRTKLSKYPTLQLITVGTHVDISRGPMIPNTSHLGRTTVTNVIKLDTDIPGDPIYSLLEDRARTLNSGRIPGSQGTETEDHTFASRVVI
ncbi:hypothetical protein NQ318_018814 [Aromia moschata]|uniref:TGS domain-containing protein n=1 Tax=Aromia moschata TaxID=1265417 RepID=A0AAV8ZID4_9CUCU|nr:hypothetical protein NQ318_018814 [Aromia moschata]